MTVLRIKKTENYVSLHKGALEDPELSFKAKGLWAYCMSRPNNWTFHVNHLATISQEGKHAVYSALQELEAAGYVKKIQENVGGRFGPVDYEVAETPEFKKSLPHPDFPRAEFPRAENPPLLNNDLCTKDREENKPRPSASPPPQAVEISQKLLEAVKKTKPDIKEPNLGKWAREADLMLRIDKRNLETVKQIIEWLPSSPFWSTNILSAEKLRLQFDKLELEMRKEPPKTASDDLQLVKKLEARVDLVSRGIIVTGADYVEFPKIRDAFFKVGEPGFREKVVNSLRKAGVPVG